MSKILQNYLKFWATGYIKRVNPEIVAITGSVGKTSAKNAIFAVLQTKYHCEVRASFGNLNNETGMPLSILDYKISPQNIFQWLPIIITAPFKSFSLSAAKILVLEMAADKPGDIRYLTSIAKPKIAVLTGISAAHLEAFVSMPALIEEKTDLLRALIPGGTAIINIDDDNARKVSYGGRWQKMTYGIANKADIEASNIKTTIIDYKPKTTFQVSYKGQKADIVQETLGEKGNVLASLAGVAVGELYGLTKDEITKGLNSLKPEKHRLNIIQGQKNTTIIDDCYNANPVSMKGALDILKNLPGGRKIAVIGDMRELGKVSTQSHKDIGQYAKNSADIVIAIGNLAKNYNVEKYYKTPKKAIEYILSNIQEGDIILIKASRAMGLEKIVEELKKNS